jgi:hypothetical protein
MKYDGGPAYPSKAYKTVTFPNGQTFQETDFGNYPGMTLRDWFAGQALQGLLAKYNLKTPGDQDTVSAMAYELADSILERRAK